MNELKKIFICTQCGFCCQGQTTVSLNEEDQKRMVKVLGKTRAEVAQEFWKITDNIVQMKTVDGHCIFYKDGCGVHEGRPHRCAQWPLVPALLSDSSNYFTIKESCPGINQEIGYEEFCRILKEYLRIHNMVIC